MCAALMGLAPPRPVGAEGREPSGESIVEAALGKAPKGAGEWLRVEPTEGRRNPKKGGVNYREQL
jgi:hypothetical protein